jgi:hypothetical protein
MYYFFLFINVMRLFGLVSNNLTRQRFDFVDRQLVLVASALALRTTPTHLGYGDNIFWLNTILLVDETYKSHDLR